MTMASAPSDEPGGPMLGVELLMVREALGLTQEALAALVGIRDPRSIRRLEAGGRPIRREMRERVEALERDTDRAVAALLRALRDARDPVVVLYADDAEFLAAHPGSLLTARWWRAVVYRAALEVPGVAFVDSRDPAAQAAVLG